MKNDKYRTYIYWGVTALTVLLLLVAAVFVVMQLVSGGSAGSKNREYSCTRYLRRCLCLSAESCV